jgi:transcriptional regulator of acetoin/glycerol metabolism
MVPSVVSRSNGAAVLVSPLTSDREDATGRSHATDRTLRAAGGRIGLTARRAGISERALFEKMRRYGLRKEDYRE